MGVVWLARDPVLDRSVALEVLRPGADEVAGARLVREARAASALSHPSIVTVHDAGTEGDERFLATELVEGETLRERLERAPLGPSEAARVASQVAAALACAHDAGFVHRDLKPENAMVRPDGVVKVLDFGLAQPHSPGTGPAATQLTAPNTVVGTAA